jgi:hypothetical protein
MLVLEFIRCLLIFILNSFKLIQLILVNWLFSKLIVFIYILFSVITFHIVHIIYRIVFKIFHLLYLWWAKIKEIIWFTILIMLIFTVLERRRVWYILRDKFFVIYISQRDELHWIFTYSIFVHKVSAYTLNRLKSWLSILNDFFLIVIIIILFLKAVFICSELIWYILLLALFKSKSWTWSTWYYICA